MWERGGEETTGTEYKVIILSRDPEAGGGRGCLVPTFQKY